MSSAFSLFFYLQCVPQNLVVLMPEPPEQETENAENNICSVV